MSFKEGIDFYYDDNGLMVLTADYLRRRGHCCHSGCKHCPYEVEDKDANFPAELRLEEDPYQKYLDQADQESEDDKN